MSQIFEKGCDELLRKIATYNKENNRKKLTLTIEDALEQFSDDIYRVAYSITKHEADAQDVYQDVFMRFMKYGIKKEFNSLEHARFWLVRVTINCFNANLEKRKRWEEEKNPRFLTEEREETSQAEDAVTETVLEAVKQLDEKYSIVVHLFY